jgi:Protein of unknown function (DUF2778)
MPWRFNSRTGQITDPTDQPFALAYSGHGLGLLNPRLESVANIGPIPRGSYQIGPAYTHIDLGPIVMNLDPLAGTETLGRSGFRIHGDNRDGNHSASHGCVVVGPDVRRAIAASLDRVLKVVA